MFSKEEIKTLIKLICDEQIRMIVKHPDSYTSGKYVGLESLKVKVKNMI